MSEKPNVVGMEEHKAKARASTAQARLCLWSVNGTTDMIVEHVAGDNVVLLTLGESGGVFDRLALVGLLERALAVLAPELTESLDEDEDDDG
jgi:hypothetical protein